MPSFAMQKRLNAVMGNTIGQVHKTESDLVMENTWYTDIDARTAFLYDQAHDEEFDIKDDLHPEKTSKIPVEIKFFEMEYNSLSKDEVAYHIMFKPSYRCNVPYYKDAFGEPLGASFPIGLYLDIPDEKEVYHRWLVVDQYREHSNQFPTYLVLPVNYKVQWVYKKKKYESWCVVRNQNSYNSGEWTSNKTRRIENQTLAWYSFNDKTKTLFYDQRIVISQVREEPLVWRCSKINDTATPGILKTTYTQQLWDAHTDYIERDESGKVIGMWADWYTDENPIDPTPIDDDKPESKVYSRITCSGTRAELKVDGGYKKFTCTFYRNDEVIDFDKKGRWAYTLNGEDATDLVNILTPEDTMDLSDNQIKVKFIGGDKYISAVMTIEYITLNGVTSSIDVAITSL